MVQIIIRNYRETSSFKSKIRSGRPKKLSDKHERVFLLKTIRANYRIVVTKTLKLTWVQKCKKHTADF